MFIKDKISRLQVGDTAPNFQALVQFIDRQENLSLEELLQKKQKVLLVFYPKDMTPGCTLQLCRIRDIYSEYQKRRVTVLGVNPGSAQEHQEFIKKENYNFGIIVDADKKIREMYGAVGSFFGKKVTKRGVFLIDEQGKIIYIFWGQQDNQKILELLDSLDS